MYTKCLIIVLEYWNTRLARVFFGGKALWLGRILVSTQNSSIARGRVSVTRCFWPITRCSVWLITRVARVSISSWSCRSRLVGHSRVRVHISIWCCRRRLMRRLHSRIGICHGRWRRRNSKVLRSIWYHRGRCMRLANNNAWCIACWCRMICCGDRR